jgi:hypothetical protein
MRYTVRVVSGVSIAFEPQSGPVSALTVRSAVLLPPRFVAPNGHEVLPYDVNGRMPFVRAVADIDTLLLNFDTGAA